MLTRGNLYCFDYAMRNLPSNNPIIEIGSFCGLSTNIINYYLKKHHKNNTIITSDKWIFEGAEQGGKIGDSQINHEQYRNHIKQTYINNINVFSQDNLPYTIEEFSDEFFKLWNEQTEIQDILGRTIKLGGNISFAFIDGNHSYDYVKRDFLNIDQYLEVGGIILFDDSFDGCSHECSKFMKEVIKHPNYQLIIKNPNYLFKKIQ
jgi:predicted O-methyltransferase YrrM